MPKVGEIPSSIALLAEYKKNIQRLEEVTHTLKADYEKCLKGPITTENLFDMNRVLWDIQIALRDTGCLLRQAIQLEQKITPLEKEYLSDIRLGDIVYAQDKSKLGIVIGVYNGGRRLHLLYHDKPSHEYYYGSNHIRDVLLHYEPNDTVAQILRETHHFPPPICALIAGHFGFWIGEELSIMGEKTEYQEVTFRHPRQKEYKGVKHVFSLPEIKDYTGAREPEELKSTELALVQVGSVVYGHRHTEIMTRRGETVYPPPVPGEPMFSGTAMRMGVIVAVNEDRTWFRLRRYDERRVPSNKDGDNTTCTWVAKGWRVNSDPTKPARTSGHTDYLIFRPPTPDTMAFFRFMLEKGWC